MKTIRSSLMAFLLLASAIPLQAQFLEKNFQLSFYNEVQAPRSSPDGNLFFVTKGINSPSLPVFYLYRLDAQGDEYHFPILTFGEPLHYDYLPIGADCIVAAAFFECDVFYPWRLFRFGSFGGLLWELDVSEQIELGEKPRLLPGPPGKFWVVRQNNQALLCHEDGQVLDSADFNLPFFESYLPLAGDTLLVYGLNGAGKCNRQLGFFQTLTPNRHFTQIVASPGGNFFAINETHIYRLDASLNALDSASLSLPPGIFCNIAADSNRIWLLAHTTPVAVSSLDTALNLVENVEVPVGAPFQPAFVATSAQQLVLLGREQQNITPFYQQVVAFRKYPPPAILDFNASADAAAMDIIAVGQHPVTITPLGLGGYFWIHYDSLQVIVKNEGNTNLQSVRLNSIYGYFTDICVEEDQYIEAFQALNLPPGGSASLDLGAFGHILFLSDTPTVSHLCFWTTLPDDQLDAYRENNRVCASFSVALDATAPEVMLPVRISPNPALETSILQWENSSGKSATVRLFDAQGGLAMEIQTRENHWILKRNNLPAGVFTVMITYADGQVYAGKIIFE